MDTPRRWQVASTATAVAGMSVGALMLGRPVSQPVETIDLDRLTVVENRSGDSEATAGREAPTDRLADIRPEFAPPELDEREMVRPLVIEDQVSGDAAASADSPEAAASPGSVDSD